MSPWVSGSGPRVARLFHALLALVLILAWTSLATQVLLLVGERGLLPVAEAVDFLRAQPLLGPTDFPSLFWYLRPTDGVLLGGCGVGIALASAALLGIAPRACLALSAPLYLSYAVACDVFTTFQWDSMLVETCVLAALVRRDRDDVLPHLLLRALLFKLYFESGVAKLQSPLGDWLDGSAMRFYYETAPLPGALAWYAHELPPAWHALESRATLVHELLVPFFFFGPRRVRLAAFAALGVFQLINLATASYGFFVWLSLALHVTLLDDDDLARVAAWLGARVPARVRALPLASWASWWSRPRIARPLSRGWARTRATLVASYATLWLIGSAALFLAYFGSVRATPIRQIAELATATQLANAYHLFTSITRERVEVQIEISRDARHFEELDFRHKPGAPTRAPHLVAPHQPRVDFRLWFYGLAYRGQPPGYVDALLDKLCWEPEVVAPLFVRPPPRSLRAVRLAFYRYTFTDARERDRTGAWWRRTRLGSSPVRACD